MIYWGRNILASKYIDDKPGSLIVGHSHKKSVWNSPPNPHHAKPTLDAFIGADWNGLSTSPPRFRMRHVRFSGSDCAGSSIGPEIVINFSGHVPIEIQFSLNSESCVRSLESISIGPVSCLVYACPCHKVTDWHVYKIITWCRIYIAKICTIFRRDNYALQEQDIISPAGPSIYLTGGAVGK